MSGQRPEGGMNDKHSMNGMNDKHSMNDMSDRRSVSGSLAGRGAAAPGGPRMARAAAWPRMARAALLSCAAALAACGGGGSSDTPPDNGQVEPIPTAIEVTLTFAGTAGAGAGGSVEITVGSESSTYSASIDFSFASGTGVSLVAEERPGYAFSGWTLAGGLSCEGGTEALTCVLEADLAAAAAGSPSVGAAFSLVATTLTVSAGANGSVAVAVAGAAGGAVTVDAGDPAGEFAFSVEAAATLTAEPDDGYAFAGWTGACEGQPAACELDDVAGSTDTAAAFGDDTGRLTVSAGANGQVAVAFGADRRGTAPSEGSFVAFADNAALPATTLTAEPDDGYAFAGWALSGVSCAGGPDANPCMLAADSVAAGDSATAGAAFSLVATTLTVSAGANGSVAVAVEGAAGGAVTVDAGDPAGEFAFSVEAAATLTAEPDDGYAFAGWTGACEGQPAACELDDVAGSTDTAAAFGDDTGRLTVSAGANGQVAVAFGADRRGTAPSEGSFVAFADNAALPATTLTAEPDDGYAFAGWALSGVSCAGGPDANPCMLAADSVAAGDSATAGAAFSLVATTLTVSAGANGSVAVAVEGAAGGAVTVDAGDPAGEFAFSVEAAATLTAEPDDGYAFAGWTGACEGQPAACELDDVAGSTDTAAAFGDDTGRLTVSAGANGQVAVAFGADRRGTAPSEGSFVAFADNAALPATTLTAEPDDGYAFAGWALSGVSCAGGPDANPCMLAADSVAAGDSATAGAAFSLVATTLTVSAGANGSVAVAVEGAAGGAVTVDAGDPAGEFAFSVEAAATLTAEPDDGYAFAGWTGACEGQPAACELDDVAGSTDTAAAFGDDTGRLTVSAGANGQVAVAFGADRRGTAPSEGSFVAFADNAALPATTLTAEPDDGYAFAGWALSGVSCAGGPDANPCMLAADSVAAGDSATAGAAFSLVATTLTVSAGANGSVAVAVEGAAGGAVTVDAGDPAGEFAFSVEAAATLTAEPDDGYAFAGWTGACEGQPAACELDDVAGSTDTAAAFGDDTGRLTVSAGANGQVAVAFGADRRGTAPSEGSFVAFADNAALPATTLTAEPDDGYAFAGWALSGVSCAGGPDANPCMLAADSVAAGDSATAGAAFSLVATTLTVSAGANGSVAVAVAGAAGGAVTVDAGDPAGEFAFSVEAAATLTAEPDDGYAFAGWTGACEGQPAACELDDVAGSTDTAAAFGDDTGRLTVSAGANGQVAVAFGADRRGTAPSEGSFVAFADNAALPATTLTAEPDDGYAFAGWALSGVSCAGGPDANPCMLAADSVAAGDSATAGAAFSLVATTLTVSAGANGSVAVAVEGAAGGAVTVDAGDPAGEFAFSVEAAATLTAEPDDGYAFAGWTGACEGQPAACELDDVAGSTDTAAAFGDDTGRLTVSAGANGQVAVAFGADRRGTAPSEGSFVAFADNAALPATTLTAEPDDGYAFAGWALSGVSCAGGPDANPCMLAADSVAAGDSATAGAAFSLVATTLTVSAGANGSVAVAVEGAAGGAVTVDAGDPAGEFAFSVEAAATLTAEPDDGYAFAGWTGACEGQPAACELDDVAGSTDTAAAFGDDTGRLTVSAGANGQVAVAFGADRRGTAPSEGSFVAFADNAALPATTLTAEPDDGYAFAGWALSGVSCAGGPDANPCMLAADSVAAGDSATAGAAFSLVATTLTVSAGANGSVAVAVEGAAGGAVTVDAGDPAGEFAFSVEAAATLTAEPDDGYAFAGWTGACEGQPAACELDDVAGSTDTAAAFGLVATTLTVSVAGAGGSVGVEATVDGNASGAEVVPSNSLQEFSFNVESTATLTAVPATDYAFFGWTGACAGQGAACALKDVVGDAEAVAAFILLSTTLTVSVSGPELAGASVEVDFGAGSPMGVANQNVRFTTSTAVAELPGTTLTATADAGYELSSWTLSTGLSCAEGATSSICTLVVGSNVESRISVEAAFGLAATTLTVSVAGAGGSVGVEATVDGNASGAEVVPSNSLQEFSFNVESTATLTAVPATDYAFFGWTGACAGQGAACALKDVVGDAEAVAAFILLSTTLTVSVSGPELAGASVEVDFGAGSPMGVANQNVRFTTSTAVAELPGTTLTATADAGYELSSWTLSTGLSCAEGATSSICTLVVGSNVESRISVEAAFGLAATTLTVSVAGAGGSVGVEATVDGNASGAEVVPSNSLQEFSFNVESTATLTAVPATDYAFFGWTGACAGQGAACALKDVVGDAEAVAAFILLSTTLTVSVSGPELAGASVEVDFGAGSPMGVANQNVRFTTSTAVAELPGTTLTATADAGYELSSWTLSTGLSCAEGATSSICTLVVGSNVESRISVEAAFGLAATTLTVSAGANGSVGVEATVDAVAGAAVTVDAGDPAGEFPFNVEATATLTAEPDDGYVFAGWTGACEGQPAACELDDVVGSTDTAAAFSLVATTLTVSAGANGSVAVAVEGAAGDAVTVDADGSPREFAFSVEAAATLTAEPDDGYAFAGWTGACEGQPAACALDDVAGSTDTAAAFEHGTGFLTVSAGANGQVAVAFGADRRGTAPSEGRFVAFADNAALPATTLTAEPDDGYAFAGWALSGVSCTGGATDGLACVLAAGSVAAGATATAGAAFELVATTLTVSVAGNVAGANGQVRAFLRDAEAWVLVDADNPTREFAFDVESTARLAALPVGSFLGWTLPSGLECAGSRAKNVCELAKVVGSVAATATFGLAATMLTVSVAGPGGSVDVQIGVADAVTVATGSPQGFAVSVLSETTLTAVAAAGYESAGWTLSLDGLECASGTATEVCALPAGLLTADVTATAAFEIVTYRLLVDPGANGDVAVTVDSNPAVTVLAGTTRGFSVDISSGVALTATATDSHSHRFAGWALSDGLACLDEPQTSPCRLAPVGADGSADAEFLPLPDAVSWVGPGAVSENGLALTAVPYADGAFEKWQGGNCDGSTAPACMRSDSGSGHPVAVFRPFVVGGIKSLAFGLGYHGDPPDHFRVSFQDASGAGFTPVPSLERLTPSSEPVRLAVPVHLLSWGLGAYMTEACDAANDCAMASGGQQTLKKTDSVAATGYFKAPRAGIDEQFGYALALSADGATLAVGAFREDSASTGTFVPGGMGYQAALDSNGTSDSGAVTVYRRSDSAWSLEAFVKAPRAGRSDQFGYALALSADGATLAVGARFEGSASAGTFAPGAPGYQAALESDGSEFSGAVTVYRRSGSTWRVEAFVKAPVAGAGDDFGSAVALSGDGATLAVGAPGEDSASAGTFAPGGEGYQTALDSGGVSKSGAVTVYRRSDVDSRWTIEAFVKAPEAGIEDQFGSALALDSSGTTLAVGAYHENSASTGTFAPGGAGYQAALDSDGAGNSGAVTVYRRSGTNAWEIEAFVKAPKAGAGDQYGDGGDQFGFALALSRDGSVLAVGARFDDSSVAGVFAPSDTGYQAALDSNRFRDSGAVTVYRRSTLTDIWTIEAFVKAPKAGIEDQFGSTLALDSSGTTLAVGAPKERSDATGTFVPDDTGYQAALRTNKAKRSGAVTVYRRSDTDAWEIETFVKVPNTGVLDQFGTALALSADGATLAVGAPDEDGGALPQPVGGDSADTGNAVRDSGAVYLY